MPDAPISPDKLLEIVIQVAVLLFAVSVHESAHGWMALRCGDTTARDLGRITLNPVKHLDPFGSLLVPALLALPLTQRTAVWLVHACGWPYSEVAEALGTSRSMVGNHVSRGLETLRRRLGVETHA